MEFTLHEQGRCINWTLVTDFGKRSHKAKKSSDKRKYFKKHTLLPSSFKLFKGLGFWKLFFLKDR